MKQDTNHVLNSNENLKVTFEELHIRHLKLLLDLKSKKLNNWFLKMAIINTCLLYTSPSPRDRH